MQPTTFHQELARARHADAIREATPRAEPARDEVVATVAEPRRQRVRLITPRLALRLVPA